MGDGFAAVGACNGLEALNFLAESKRAPVLILLDLMMPILDGWTFCKVRQGVSMLMQIPVIAISGRRDAILDAALKRESVMAILSKPFDDAELLRLIEDALRMR